MRTSERTYTGMRRGHVAALLAITSAVLVGACGISDEPPPSGDPKVIAAAAATESAVARPVPEPEAPITMVSHEPAVAVPSNTTGNVTYGDAEKVFRAGRYEEATELFEAYTTRKPENLWGHYMLGISAWKAGDHNRAESALRRTLELDPSHAKALVNLGRVLLEQNRPAAALDFTEEAVAVTPESVDAWRVLANVRAGLGAVEQAVEAYRRALVLDDKDAWSMNNLGLLMIREGRYEEALPPLARAVELRPGTAVFQNNLGVALERAGHLVDAADAFRAAIGADPEHARAKTSLARVEERATSGEWPMADLAGLAGSFADQIRFWREATVPADSTKS